MLPFPGKAARKSAYILTAAYKTANNIYALFDWMPRLSSLAPQQRHPGSNRTGQCQKQENMLHPHKQARQIIR